MFDGHLCSDAAPRATLALATWQISHLNFLGFDALALGPGRQRVEGTVLAA